MTASSATRFSKGSAWPCDEVWRRQRASGECASGRQPGRLSSSKLEPQRHAKDVGLIDQQLRRREPSDVMRWCDTARLVVATQRDLHPVSGADVREGGSDGPQTGARRFVRATMFTNTPLGERERVGDDA